MIEDSKSQTLLRLVIYASAAILLILDSMLLLRALFAGNVVPIAPVFVGILTAAGLLIVMRTEERVRQDDKKEHYNIARVAHQLLAPLKNVQEQLEQLMSNTKTLPPETRLNLKHLETKTNLLLENIRDVFLTLQAQAGPIAQEIRVYDLCTLLQEAYKRSLPQASAHNVELIYKTHCSDAPVRVDKRLFLIALTHILENAIVYTATPGLVNLTVIRGKDDARIVVQDRGIGIKEEDQKTLWEPFVRGKTAEKYHPSGIGIGTTLAKRIMKELGGTITWKDRKQSLGTQCEIKLPLAT